MNVNETIITGHTSAPTVNVTTPQENVLASYQNAGDAQIQTRFSMDLDQNSLVSIAVAEAEKQIRQKLAALLKEKTAQETRLADYMKLRDKYLTDWVENQTSQDNKLMTFIGACESILNKKPTLTYNTASYNVRTKKISGTLTVSGDSLSYSTVFANDPSNDFTNNLKFIEDIELAIKKLNTEILGARTALNNVDSIERSAKAKMAETVASRSGEAGKALVESIRQSIGVDDLIEHLRV